MASRTHRLLSTRCRRLIVLGAFLSLCNAGVFAEPLTSIPNPRARDGTWVTDMAGALRADTVARLNATISEFERATGGEMAVVVVRSLDGLTIEEAAVKLFELWKIGKERNDNGLLLLWSAGDRRVRVEVGYGLEGALPDGKVGAILDALVIPRFRSGEFDEGLLAGVDALIRVARDEPMDLPSPQSASYGSEWPGVVAAIGLLGGLPLTVVGSIVGYRKWRRRHRQAEERVKSIDYDVWKCPSCGHHFTLRYPKWFSSYSKCSQCHYRTKSSIEEVLTAATETGTGSARVIETCAFFRRLEMPGQATAAPGEKTTEEPGRARPLRAVAADYFLCGGGRRELSPGYALLLRKGVRRLG